MSAPSAPAAPRLAFIVGEDRGQAVRCATEGYRWIQIAAWRFVDEHKTDIRVIDQIGEFRSFGPLTRIYRAWGFDKRPDKAKWHGLVEASVACWGEPEPPEYKNPIARDNTSSKMDFK